MSPQDTELWKLSRRHFYTETVLHLLAVQGEKYLNTFIVTNANDCPDLLSHGATFRMGVLLPNYLEENVVNGENVPNFKFNTSTGTSTGTSQMSSRFCKIYD